MLLSPVVRLLPLPTPIAMLPPPIMLLWSAKKPIAVLLAPSVLCSSAPSPTAVLKKPVLFEKSANAPLAVFWKPLVLLKSAPAPVAVFSPAELLKSAPAPIPVQRLPSVILSSEYTSIPVLYTPVVRLPRARYPSAKLPPGQPGSGESQAARVCGENAKLPAAKTVRHSGVTFLNWRMSVFMMCSSFVFPAELFLEARVRKGRRTEQGVESSARVKTGLVDAEFRRNLFSGSRQF